MPRVRVKICGITRIADALAAANSGADAIGLIFHDPAPRNVPLDTAVRIVTTLPPFVTPVGVFVNASIDTIRKTCTQLRIRHIQLNGSDTPETVAELADFTVIKSIKVTPTGFEQTLSTWREKISSLTLTNLHAFVLETPGPAPGGSGQSNDWDHVLAAQRIGAFDGLPPIIAAGGLNPENVAQVVSWIKPYAVDVSSGVEESLSRKSPDKIRAFIRAATS